VIDVTPCAERSALNSSEQHAGATRRCATVAEVGVESGVDEGKHFRVEAVELLGSIEPNFQGAVYMHSCFYD
jgi:hypothetical protein